MKNGKADVDDVLEILNKLDIYIDNVYGIQQVGYCKTVVKLHDDASALFEELMKVYDKRVFTLDERNTKVQIVNLSFSKVVVTSKHAPFKLPKHLLYQVPSQYGQVFNIRTQTTVPKTIRESTMENIVVLKSADDSNKPIPSSIVLGRVPVFISYKGQPPTCLRCGCPGHFAADCTVGYWGAVNRIYERDFSDLRKGKEVPTAANGVITCTESRHTAKTNAETERNNVATEESEKAAHSNSPLREN